MKKFGSIVLLALLINFLASNCGDRQHDQQTAAAIGHFLFFDKRLSFNGTKSCASCHDPAMAFTDGYHRSIGANGDVQQRNSPTLINIAAYQFYTDGDSSIKTLQQQIQIPLFNHQFTELGDERAKPGILGRLNRDSNYRKLLSDYIPARPTFDWTLVIECLTEYCRGLKSYGSKYDAVVAAKSAFTKEEAEGSKLFFGRELRCGNCHSGKDFNQPLVAQDDYANNGFYQNDSSHVERKFGIDSGLAALTRVPADVGKFRIPTLRNCMITAPYMHDGSVHSMDSVLAGYARGGNRHFNKHPLIRGFNLDENQKFAVLAFMNTLTDTSFLQDEYFLDPLR